MRKISATASHLLDSFLEIAHVTSFIGISHAPKPGKEEHAMPRVADQLNRLRILTDISALINSTLDTREIRKRAIEAATLLMHAETGSLLLVDAEHNELFFEVVLGEQGEKLKEIRLQIGQGIAGWVAKTGEPLIIHDVQNDRRFYRGADEKSDFRTCNMLCVPVKSRDTVIGVLQAINKKDGSFDNDDLETLASLANQVAVAIENARLYEELRETFYGTTLALAETLEKRDPYTGGHVRRVRNYSMAIGRGLGMSAKDLERLKLSAILHDIGKIGVRDSILLKEGRLDPDELDAMNQHSLFGAEILQHVRYLQDVIPGVKGHHEKYDGSGYPDGLREQDIPLNARIIAVADTFDAMTTDRPYRKALSFPTAFAELTRGCGTQFDARVVETFIKAYQEGEI
jgi:putative nucleotidyltransferase with HDIG domain